MSVVCALLSIAFMLGGTLPILQAQPPAFHIDWHIVWSCWLLSLFFAWAALGLARLPFAPRSKNPNWTDAEIDADLNSLYKDLTGNYTAEERRQMDAADTANYINHISGHAMREVSYSIDERTMYWNHYVIDQQGRRHILESGQVEVMPSLPHVPEFVIGEPVEDERPAMRLQDGRS